MITTQSVFHEIEADWTGSIAFGISAKTTKWTNRKVELAGLVTGLTQHHVGAKDGPGILQGATKDGTRKAAAMESLCIIALDVDGFVFLLLAISRLLWLCMTG